MSFRPIFGLPRLNQDWGDEQHEKETHWTSLFYDLMVVAALNAIAEPFEEEREDEDESTFSGLTPIQHIWLDALLQFVSVVNPWNFLNEYTSTFQDESLIGHISFFVHAFGMAATTAGCVGELEENYIVLGTGILLAKIGLLVLYVRPILFSERPRVHMSVRGASHLVNIALILRGMQFPFDTFRVYLIVASIWDYGGLLLIIPLKHHRLPLHVQSFADRIQEVTMVIFGEAIFAIILQPYSERQPHTHFYLALGATLWLIFSMALQEFHILPKEHDHALRRSLWFGFLWFYTQFFKQFCLLATSIGVKRAHLLMFKAPLDPIDSDTRRLIVWGLSMTMLAVILIRSYSFGFGRHPSPDDPPALYRLKMAWWIIMLVIVLAPQAIDSVVLEHYSSQPLVVLISFGCFMGAAILCEGAMSNLVANHMKKLYPEVSGGDEAGEMTYLHSVGHLKNYSSRDGDSPRHHKE